MPTLKTTVDGLNFLNPFVIASGPPGTNLNVMNRAFKEGWGGVIAKTVSLDASKVVNVTPRYGKLLAHDQKEVIGWENIELISDRPIGIWVEEFKKCKDAHPEGILIASIMEEYNKDAWAEIVGLCQNAGVDGFELNFSCPHGLPERKMGAAMGQDPEILGEVCHGVSAINTIRSVIGVNLDTLRPEPSVEGYTTPGGYSSKAVRPIALRMCMELATMIRQEFPGKTLSGMGGIETGGDAAQFILLGSDTVQVCTGVMKFGYGMVKALSEELLAFMEKHKFETLDDFKGMSLPYFTTHAELVRMQKDRKAAEKAAADARMVQADGEWSGDDFVKQSSALSR
jgi:dihydropyrimidine dehydrogenase (NADP+)/dihydropyrimidine dehydrogenase (NAD+) subunit PreA